MSMLKVLCCFLVLLVYETQAGPQCQNLKPNDRFDCGPDPHSSQKACEGRGCCWNVATPVLNGAKPGLGVPWCYYPTDYVGYRVDSIDNYSLRTVVTLKRKVGSGFRNDSQTVIVDITEINENSVRY